MSGGGFARFLGAPTAEEEAPTTTNMNTKTKIKSKASSSSAVTTTAATTNNTTATTTASSSFEQQPLRSNEQHEGWRDDPLDDDDDLDHLINKEGLSEEEERLYIEKQDSFHSEFGDEDEFHFEEEEEGARPMASGGGSGNSGVDGDEVTKSNSAPRPVDAFVKRSKVFAGLPEPQFGGGPAGSKSLIFSIVKQTKEFKTTQMAITELHQRHNGFAGTISIQRDVTYMPQDDGNSKHKLDIFYPVIPAIVIEGGVGRKATRFPVVIHFHGGGWVRGDRKDEFRGAPASCREYAANGIIAVAPSYTLGNACHMEDAVAAVTWVINHADKLGADPRFIFVSGHSAGANIAANLVVGSWLDDVLSKNNVSIAGAVLISGVYTLVKPLGGTHFIMNKAFDKMYRLPVFGKDKELLVKHSPTYQIKLRLGEEPSILKSCKIVEFFHAREKKENTSVSLPVLRPLVKFFVLNAEDDLGLGHDGKKFTDLLICALTSDRVSYHVLEGHTHASIALSGTSLAQACTFINDTYRNIK